MKLTTVLFFLISSFAVQAQNPSKQHYLDTYKRGLKYNDTRVAINALQGYLALGEDAAYKDTLSMLYYISSDYLPALLISDEIREADNKNIGALERVAGCYAQLGQTKKAVEFYEQLCPVTKNPYHYYQLAQSQYQLKRVAECTQNLQRILIDTNSKNIATPFTVAEGQVQNVPVMAAGYNMLGVIEMEAKNFEKANTFFTKAMEVFPNFVGAYQNMEEIKRITKAGGKSTGQPKPKPPTKKS
jgi:tetratricopeptide (TPR) repeat protein